MPLEGATTATREPRVSRGGRLGRGSATAGIVQRAMGAPYRSGSSPFDLVQMMLDLEIVYAIEQSGAEAGPVVKGRALADTLVQAATRFGTPLYVVDEEAVGRAAAEVEGAFAPNFLLSYSLKANDLPEVAALLRARGWGGNVVSAGEWAQAARAGFAEDEITFEGIGKADAELEDVVAAASSGRPLRWVVVESREELVTLAALARGAGLGGGRPPLDVLLRLNPGVAPETIPGLDVGAQASKFGMTRREIVAAASSLAGAPSLRLRGVHVHVGSQLASAGAWAEAGRAAVDLASELSRGHDLCDTVDFGGGFPAVDSGWPTPLDFRTSLERALSDGALERPARMAVEPGRFLVASAGYLVTSVLHVRDGRGTGPLIVVDAGMTELIRPALYGASHPIGVLRARSDGPTRPTSVEGPVCESTDTLGTHPLPPLRRGDLLVIGESGAYGASFTSRYNGRPQPRELLLAADGSLRLGERAPLRPHRPPHGGRPGLNEGIRRRA